MPDPFLYYIHLTKTGGSSFKQMLQRNLRNHFYSSYGYIWEDPYHKEQLQTLMAQFPEFHCFSSHRLCLDIPFDDESKDVRAVTFIRDPASRFLSHYFFHRNNSMPGYDEVKQMSVSEYIEFALAQKHEDWLIDGQFKALTQYEQKPDIGAIKELVESGKLILLPLNRFDEGCLLMKKEFPSLITDASYVKQNISIRDQKVSDEQKARIQSFMDYDYQLLEMANQCLDDYQAKHYSDKTEIQKELQAHRKRCVWRRRIFWTPRKTAGKILRALKLLR